jgi:hypothetical protein
MRTRSQTKNEALKTKSSKSTVEKPVTRSSVEKTFVKTYEKPITRSSNTLDIPSFTNNVQTHVDTSVHLINSMIFSSTNDRVIQKPPKPILYEPIDFDDASACWRMNKQSLGNGQYKYVCAFMKIDNTRCGRNVKKGCMACRYHV